MRTGSPSGVVGVCDTQPVVAEGVRVILQEAGLDCLWTSTSLLVAVQKLRRQALDILLLDKALGYQSLVDCIEQVHALHPNLAPVVWGVAMGEQESLRLLQAGARGILHRTADRETLLHCVRTVLSGGVWLADQPAGQWRKTIQPMQQHSGLTVRESQVLELIEQGLKNREIANELGIRPGTVKVHLRHIFEKTGVRGRYGLALNGIRQRRVPDFPVQHSNAAGA